MARRDDYGRNYGIVDPYRERERERERVQDYRRPEGDHFRADDRDEARSGQNYDMYERQFGRTDDEREELGRQGHQRWARQNEWGRDRRVEQDSDYYASGGHRWRRQGTSDDEIQDNLYDAIDDNPRIPENADIRIEVHNGIVSITGAVRNRRAKMAVNDIAWNCPGVEDVNNNIIVNSRRLEQRLKANEDAEVNRRGRGTAR
jgi:hypothetical protein